MIKTLRGALPSFVLVICLATIASSAAAQTPWPTTSWTIQKEPLPPRVPRQLLQPPKDDALGSLQPYADKHQWVLEDASVWFESMGFRAPRQRNDQGRFGFLGGEKYLAYLNRDRDYLGSYYAAGSGTMVLSSHPGFLSPTTENDRVLQAAAAHELFHGIQAANPAYRAYAYRKDLPGSTRCDVGERADGWLTDGTAAAVQIMYLESRYSQYFDHGVYGPSDVRWMRHFDQPLDWPRLPKPEKQGGSPVDHVRFAWQCEYGTWYFWYAVGNMLASSDLHDTRRVSYLRHIFERNGPWEDTGLDRVDAGLKQAAKLLGSLRPYQNGLYSLYPQFVAQYLDIDEFFENVQHVTMEVPSVYQTEIAIEDALEPLATMAWRVRVQMPTGPSQAPTTVRFVLDTPNPQTKEALHLIIDDKIVAHPVDASVPHSQLRRVHSHLLDENGGIEFFVRVANVARHAIQTTDATFTLKVEVEGFYGEAPEDPKPPLISPREPSSPSDSRTHTSHRPGMSLNQSERETPAEDSPDPTIEVPLAVPPGFLISGPDDEWNCEGGDSARATYSIVTPNGLADQLERMLPQSLQNIESDLDQAEIEAHGRNATELEAVQRQREGFEDELARAMATSNVQHDVARAAREIRAQEHSQVLIKLHGRNGAGDCDVMLILTLPGAPAPQRVPADNFRVTVTSAAVADAMATAMDTGLSFIEKFDFTKLETMDLQQMELMAEQLENAMANVEMPSHPWSRCESSNPDCEAGSFELGEVSEQRLFGSFAFQVYRGDLQLVRGSPPEHPREYDEVTGFVNITSTKDDGDNNLLDFLSRFGGAGDLLHVPGLEAFLQGGSMLRD